MANDDFSDIASAFVRLHGLLRDLPGGAGGRPEGAVDGLLGHLDAVGIAAGGQFAAVVRDVLDDVLVGRLPIAARQHQLVGVAAAVADAAPRLLYDDGVRADRQQTPAILRLHEDRLVDAERPPLLAGQTNNSVSGETYALAGLTLSSETL